MNTDEGNGMDVHALAELDAVDAALAREHVAEPHYELAALALALRETRPQPSDELRHALDERAAARFTARKGARRGTWQLLAPFTRHPPLALAALVLVAAAIALPLALLGHSGGESAARPDAEMGSASGRQLSPEPAGAPRAKAPPGSHQNGESSSRPGPAAATGATPARQVEHATSIEVGVARSAIESASQRVFTLASAFGGFVQQSNVTSADGETAGASFSLRVPSSNLAGAMAAFAHLGHVRSENETTNDVTEAHGSLERSLADARAERASLLTQLEHASGTGALEALKAKLHATEAHIGQLDASLRALDSRVDYTGVSLALFPEAQGGGAAGDLTPSGAIHDAGVILAAGLAVLVLAAAALIPLALVIAVAGLALTGTRRALRERALDAS